MTGSPAIARRRRWGHLRLVSRVAAVVFISLAAGVPAQQAPSPSDERQLDVTYTELWQRGEYHAALAALEREQESMSPVVSAQLRYDRAQLLFAVGRVDEAIEDLKWFAERQPQPSYSLELALMYKYRGMPLQYEKWLVTASQQLGRNYHYRRRSENVAAQGHILELVGNNPKTILTAHFGYYLDAYRDLGAAAYIGAGDMAYRHAGYDIAEGYYLQALEKEPENQEALAGLLECYWRSSDEREGPTAERLAALNPNHPRLDAVKVEHLLEGLQLEDARGIIERQLAINPVNHRFRSLKAAALYLANDTSGMDDVVEATLDYNPVRSEIYRTIGRFASRHYRFKDGLAFQEKALELDTKDYEARALYTLDLMRVGRELEGRAELEKAFEADPFNVELSNLLQLMNTLEDFDTIERGPFVLRLPKRESPVLAEAILDLLDEEIGLLEKKYRVKLETPILIEMFDNHDDFMVRSVGLPGNAGHLGICFGQLVTMDAPSVRPPGSSNWRSVLWHEFAHVISLQKTRNRMPRWLSEGISVYEEGQRSDAWHNRLDPNYAAILATDGIPGLRSIDGYFTKPKSGMHLMYGYFTAGEFISFYTKRYGFDALVIALEKIAGGSWAEDALVAAANASFEELDKDFHAHLQERFAAFKNLPPVQQPEPGAAGRIAQQLAGAAPAPPSSPFTDALNEGREALERNDVAEAEAAWNRAYELFPDYAGGDAPLRQLARLYEAQDRRDDLIKTLERVRMMTPQELEATLKLARLYREDGNWQAVAETTDWAIGIDPYDPKTQRLYAEALVGAGKKHEAIDTLAVLTHLDPGNDSDYRLQRAGLLYSAGDREPAKREVIALLEKMPHYWDAQKLLLDIVDARDGQPPAAEPAAAEAAPAGAAPQ